jgi:hypothetical protein
MKLVQCAPLLALLLACAATPSAKSPQPIATTDVSSADGAAPSGSEATKAEGPVVCDLVCERARVVRRERDAPDYHARATEDANRVLAAMGPDLLACYQKRVTVDPRAHGFITVDIIVGPDGRVIDVETTGGAILGKGTMDCMRRRIEKGVFEPPHGGGTLRIQAPFSLRRLAPDEEA